MTGKKRFAVSLLVICALIVLCGCASGKGQQAMSGDYRKMVDLQQRKATAIKAEEPAFACRL